MKFLKLTLVAILSLTLLTAVLPSSETELKAETSNKEVKKTEIKLTANFEKTKGANAPRNG